MRVSARGNEISVQARGENGDAREEKVHDLLNQLAGLQARGIPLGREEIKTAIGLMERDGSVSLSEHFIDGMIRTSTRKAIIPKTRNQRLYLQAMMSHDLVLA